MQNKTWENIPFKSALPPAGDLAARNKAFNALPPEQQRREIAYDAINLLLSGVVSNRIHAFWSDALHDLNYVVKNATELQQKLVNDLPDCDVCERGLFMLSQIRLGNEIDFEDDDIACGSTDNLKGFDYDTFNKLEEEYEHDHYDGPYPQHSIEKMANICCNVIQNGDFDTYDRTDYLELWKIKL